MDAGHACSHTFYISITKLSAFPQQAFSTSTPKIHTKSAFSSVKPIRYSNFFPPSAGNSIKNILAAIYLETQTRDKQTHAPAERELIYWCPYDCFDGRGLSSFGVG